MTMVKRVVALVALAVVTIPAMAQQRPLRATTHCRSGEMIAYQNP